MCYIVIMLNNRLKYYELGLTQLKVWVDEELKKDFQIQCLKEGTNMTAEIEKLLRQYLSDRKISGATR